MQFLSRYEMVIYMIVALGKTERTTRSMVKNWGLGAWQAQYAVSPTSN